MNHRKWLLFGFFIFGWVIYGLACSSFAAYSNVTMVGSNFDYYPEFQYRVAIFRHPLEYDYFAVQFSVMPSYAYTTVGMNDQGLFANLQDVPQMVERDIKNGKFSLSIQEYLEWQLRYMKSAQESLDYLDSIRLSNIPPYYHHTMVADRYGTSFIVAPGETDHEIYRYSDNFTIQTNFYLTKQLFNQSDEVPCWRYREIYRRLHDSIDDLDVFKGFYILEGAFQGIHTQISTVFLLDDLEVYFAIQTDTQRIFRVSLKSGLLETFSGFSEYRSMILDDTGVWLSDLQEWE